MRPCASAAAPVCCVPAARQRRDQLGARFRRGARAGPVFDFLPHRCNRGRRPAVLTGAGMSVSLNRRLRMRSLSRRQWWAAAPAAVVIVAGGVGVALAAPSDHGSARSEAGHSGASARKHAPSATPSPSPTGIAGSATPSPVPSSSTGPGAMTPVAVPTPRHSRHRASATPVPVPSGAPVASPSPVGPTPSPSPTRHHRRPAPAPSASPTRD